MLCISCLARRKLSKMDQKSPQTSCSHFATSFSTMPPLIDSSSTNACTRHAGSRTFNLGYSGEIWSLVLHRSLNWASLCRSRIVQRPSTFRPAPCYPSAQDCYGCKSPSWSVSVLIPSPLICMKVQSARIQWGEGWGKFILVLRITVCDSSLWPLYYYPFLKPSFPQRSTRLHELRMSACKNEWATQCSYFLDHSLSRITSMRTNPGGRELLCFGLYVHDWLY
mgnify:CR=1 FL=1